MLPVISQVLPIELVLLMQPQLSRRANQTQIIIDPKRPHVEEVMMIRTQAQQVVHGIWPIVGPTQRTNVCSFRVETCRPLQLQSADLTTAFVEFFEPTAQERIPNNPIDSVENARGRVIARRYRKLGESPSTPG